MQLVKIFLNLLLATELWIIAISSFIPTAPEEDEIELQKRSDVMKSIVLKLKSATVKQSSTAINGAAANAVDGKSNPEFDDGSCSQTKMETDAWWQVALEFKSFITTVDIYNRNKYGNRLRNFKIFLSDTVDHPRFDQQCHNDDSPIGNRMKITVPCRLLAEIVRIQLKGPNKILTLCEVRLFGYHAFLLGIKSVRQSSTYYPYGVATNAIDGYYGSEVFDYSCSQTHPGTIPWWEAQLDYKSFVTAIKIGNRINYGEDLGGLEILAYNDEKKHFHECGFGPFITQNGQTYKIFCGRVTDKVRLHIPGEAKHLILCDVKIYGDMVLPLRSARQISTYPNGDAKNAIDGNTDPVFMNGSCTHTHIESAPWWQVNLQVVSFVSNVQIWNRKDLGDRLAGFIVQVTDWERSNYIKCASGPRVTKNGEVYTLNCGQLASTVRVQLPPSGEFLTLCEVRIYGYVGIWSSWSEWSDCLPMCLSGSRSRTRSCNKFKSEAECLGSDTYIEKCKEDCVTLPYDPDSVTQSSTLNTEVASRAVDGNNNQRMKDAHCSSTDSQYDPWWQLDLRVTSFVFILQIWNRHSNLGERLAGFKVLVSKLRTTTDFIVCGSGPTSLTGGEIITVHCKQLARRVRIQIPGVAKYLALCEVKIYGDIALKLTLHSASQSSTYEEYYARYAIDGNHNEIIFTDYFTRTQSETYAWWQAELEVTSFVSVVQIWKRLYKGVDMGVLSLILSKEGDSQVDEFTNFYPKYSPLGKKYDIHCAKLADKVKILNFGENIQNMLLLNEVEVYGSPAVEIKALNASLSSTGRNGQASRAIDGNLAQKFRLNSCSRSQSQTDPWWMVDLQQTSYVAILKIWAQKYYGERSKGMTIYVTNNGSDPQFYECANRASYNTISTPQGDIHTVFCGEITKRLKIVKPSSGKELILRFCEVKFFGKIGTTANLWSEWTECSSICGSGIRTRSRACNKYKNINCIGDESETKQCVNICLRLPFASDSAIQSTTLDYGVASRAIDGNTDQRYDDGSCTHTEEQTSPFWQVDLKIESFVSTVQIWNRATQGQRLAAFKVLVWKSGRIAVQRFDLCKKSGPSVTPSGGVFIVPCRKLTKRVRILVRGLERFLTLCEVKIYGNFGHTFTLHSTTQSSTHGEKVASYAIDGNTNQDFDGEHYTRTKTQTNPWWEVTLGAKYFVSIVQIWKRTYYGERLEGFAVILTKRDGKPNKDCDHYDLEQSMNGEKYVVHCEKKTRTVKIQLIGKDKILSLNEVEVFGSPDVELKAVSAKQSSTYPNGDAIHAIDSNTKQRFESGSCSHTNFQSDPWWLAELKHKSLLSTLTIWNRKSNGERLNGFLVMVSEGKHLRFSVCAKKPSEIINTRKGQILTVFCGSIAKLVKIQIPGGGKILCLCEVKFFGTIEK